MSICARYNSDILAHCHRQRRLQTRQLAWQINTTRTGRWLHFSSQGFAATILVHSAGLSRVVLPDCLLRSSISKVDSWLR